MMTNITLDKLLELESFLPDAAANLPKHDLFFCSQDISENLLIIFPLSRFSEGED